MVYHPKVELGGRGGGHNSPVGVADGTLARRLWRTLTTYTKFDTGPGSSLRTQNEGTPLSLPRWNQLSRLMSVGEQVMAHAKLKLPCKKSIVQKSYECQRNHFEVLKA